MKISPRHALFTLALIAATSASAAGPDESAFLAENEAAMTKMMAAMEIQPSGDVDKDFVAMMTPHHQAAIDMAQAMLRYGHNEQLRHLAQQIIEAQQQEIVTMRMALGQPPTAPSPTAGQSRSGHSMRMQREP